MNKKTQIGQKKKFSWANFLVVLPIIVSLLVPTFPLSMGIAHAAADSALYFSEVGVPGTPVTSEEITAGDNFSLDVAINPGTNQVSGAELHVTYDPTKFSLTSITAPSAPANCTNTPTFSNVLQSASIDNDNGTASIVLGVCTATPPPTVTTTTVATFSFHAIAATTALPIEFADSTYATAIGEPGDVLLTKTGVNVTVDAAAEPEEPGDSTAPVISNGTPSGELSRGTTTSTISVTTNENATCKYSTSSGVAYASMTGTFTTTGTTTHSFAGTGFSNGNGYRYYVRCQDSATNVNASDYTISFSIDKSSSKKKEVKKTKRKIYNSQKKLKRGDVLVQRGKRFSKNSTVMLYFSKFGGGYYAPMAVKTSKSGTFSVAYKINKPAGTYKWYAVDTKTGKKSKTKTYRVR